MHELVRERPAITATLSPQSQLILRTCARHCGFLKCSWELRCMFEVAITPKHVVTIGNSGWDPDTRAKFPFRLWFEGSLWRELSECNINSTSDHKMIQGLWAIFKQFWTYGTGTNPKCSLCLSRFRRLFQPTKFGVSCELRSAHKVCDEYLFWIKLLTTNCLWLQRDFPTEFFLDCATLNLPLRQVIVVTTVVRTMTVVALERCSIGWGVIILAHESRNGEDKLFGSFGKRKCDDIACWAFSSKKNG